MKDSLKVLILHIGLSAAPAPAGGGQGGLPPQKIMPPTRIQKVIQQNDGDDGTVHITIYQLSNQ